MVSWHSSCEYAAWLSERTGQAWRLACELEWEKAARGVDGRLYPWGDAFDPSWTCMARSHEGRLQPRVVDSCPTDVSPYGVRGLGGNAMDWCLDIYDDPFPASGRLVVEDVLRVRALTARPVEPLAAAPGSEWRITAGRLLGATPTSRTTGSTT